MHIILLFLNINFTMNVQKNDDNDGKIDKIQIIEMSKEENLIKDYEIETIFKDVLKNHQITDSVIIENLKLINDSKRIQTAFVEIENYSLLHIAAEYERALLCAYLIDAILTGIYFYLKGLFEFYKWTK